MRIAIINGPNLNLLGRRETSIYGTQTMEQCWVELVRRFPEVELVYFQSNHEGDIIDKLQEFGTGFDGIILNAGAYTHTSIAIRDAVSAIAAPVVEVHISDISQREPFRRHSYLTDVCVKTIMGHGMRGYEEGVRYLMHNA